MKWKIEIQYIAGWLLFFFASPYVVHYSFIGGVALSTRFPRSAVTYHACVLSAIALSLLISYLLFRTIVRYLARSSFNDVTPTS